MHTLDVLIPHYNDPEGLKLSLQSVAEQDWHGSRRIIVVDDGSGAENLKRIKAILHASDCDCVLIEHPHNMGRPAARNTALRAVTAPYMAWLDAGDVWYHNKISAQFRYLRALEDAGEDSKKIWVSCHFDWHEKDKTRFVCQDVKPDMFKELLVGKSFRAYLWTLFGRTEAFRTAGLFDVELPRLQDLDYFLRFVKAGGKFAVPPKRRGLCCYYKSDVGRNHREVSQSAQHIFEKYRPGIEQAKIGGQMRWKNAQLAGRFAVNNGEPLAVLTYLGSAVLYSPRYALYKLRRRLLR